MVGKRYYLATLGGWRRHASRFANSHFILLDVRPASAASLISEPPSEGNCVALLALNDATPILALVEADEGAHLVIEDDPAFEALPHPLAQKPISEAAQCALAAQGVAPGATTLDVAEALARIHPLLRHRVF